MAAVTSPAPKKYKVVLLGESGVGKTSLVQRLAKNEWCENQNSTVGASFFRYACPLGDTAVHFDIWDTAGQERYKSLASMYYRGAAAALVVYEIPSYETFERAKYWVRELAANSPETIVYLVGNKSDIRDASAGTEEGNSRRFVCSQEVAAYARECNMMFSEASARNGTGVNGVFAQIAKQLVAANSDNIVREGGVLGTQAGSQPVRSRCCA
ncbi:ADP ribosylation factor family Ras of Complex Roc domain [Trypanosoma vivax]|uniref:Putative small GTP-binding protein Rab5b n=1 Tax=Trypanosoma vivax (strain Y486) TaxID=1055687 RepID=G0UAZ8_TRYVY|nr:putative small GTP-binding protein Rab5b [Trypanosoma vivax]KAH8611318.1 ADP ribosylation factor family Ras of Complex Roc domain [Trypanosoma vivax]CCC52985.1 putative small GTP-binding protein Rab5b [Trypanosoma vivax Y486]